MYKHILVAADDSAPAKSAFETATRLAAQLGASLTVVHVADPARERIPETVPSTGATKDLGTGFGVTLGEWCSQVPGKSTAPELLVPTGPAARVIHDLTKSMRWDLLVLGTRERGPLSAFLGSVTEDVLKRSDIPVLVVRHHAN